MYKTIIIDDEKGCRESMHKLLQHFTEIQIIGEADSISKASVLIEELQPQLLFLDIDMPGGNVFELLEKFNPATFDVIFTTAYHKYAIKAIKFSALDYLLKPIDIEELKGAIARFTTKKYDQISLNTQFKTLLANLNEEKSHQKIAIPDGEGTYFVKIKNIIRFQSEGSYTYLYTTERDKPIFISKPIGEYQEMLNNESFIRVHRSHLINIEHVTKYVRIGGGYAIMSDNTKVDISRRKKGEFSEALAKL